MRFRDGLGFPERTPRAEVPKSPAFKPLRAGLAAARVFRAPGLGQPRGTWQGVPRRATAGPRPAGRTQLCAETDLALGLHRATCGGRRGRLSREGWSAWAGGSPEGRRQESHGAPGASAPWTPSQRLFCLPNTGVLRWRRLLVARARGQRLGANEWRFDGNRPRSLKELPVRFNSTGFSSKT